MILGRNAKVTKQPGRGADLRAKVLTGNGRKPKVSLGQFLKRLPGCSGASVEVRYCCGDLLHRRGDLAGQVSKDALQPLKIFARCPGAGANRAKRIRYGFGSRNGGRTDTDQRRRNVL